ncbi:MULTISPECIES: LPFR motif small protein [Actinomadura]|uniref:LPFR motif small protein n=1 Tax=Actinomadura yumaensis TaxID=111807 RepID=A0ABW2CCZ0_9ACTN|nr:LPFR motif small protein [Actinomadura sp. J1-007]
MRRITAALRSIIATIVNVVTLPFRVLLQLLTPSGRAGRRTSRRTRRAA